MVLWFLGLSGSGKTTLAKLLKDRLSQKKILPNIDKWVLLDGDVIRTFLGDEIGYNYEDRRKSVKVMGLLASELSKTGTGVLVANISPFHDLRLFMRNNIKDYYEIYCKTTIEECIKRDPKGFYKKQLSEGVNDYVGLDLPFQESTTYDLLIETTQLTESQSLELIEEFMMDLARRDD